MADLQQKLNELSLTRPDKMNAASQLILDANYPPEDLLNGIAHLLTIHFDQ
jgi:hypothetical protein